MNKLKQSQNKGFTLVEMMVSVLIFGVMASIIFPALIQFLDARDRIESKQSQLIGLQKTFLFLAQDMRFASNRVGKDEFGEQGQATMTVGENDALVELTVLYPDLNLDGLGVPRRVKWVLDEGILQRLQYPVMDPDSDTRIIRQNLVSGVESVDIELKRIDDGREEVSDSWDEQSRLPDLLELSILFDNGIEYTRAFSMLNGDTLDAIAAVQAAGTNVPNEDDDPDAREDADIDEESNLPDDNQGVNDNSRQVSDDELLPLDEEDIINGNR